MISETMIAVLNTQIKHELYSSHLYLAMSAYCDRLNLKGFAHWMRLQADEERGHALKFYDYLLQLAVPVKLEAIDQPPVDYGTPKNVFVQVLEHERKVTALIHGLYERALSEKDYRTQIMLQWFVNEQIEEEEQAMEILTKIEQVDERMSSILWIDK